MRIAQLLTMCLVTLGCYTSSLAEVPIQRQSELVEGYRSGVLRDVQPLSPDEKDFLKKYIRSLIDQGIRDDAMLFKLGDEEVTSRWVRAWNEGDQITGREFVNAARPEVIAMIAPSLLQQEAHQIFGSDSYSLPGSFGTAITVLNIIKRSGVFSNDVLRWSQEVDFPVDVSDKKAWLHIRDGVQTWFKENEALLESERFSEVKPGPSLRQAAPVTSGSASQSTASSEQDSRPQTTEKSSKMPRAGLPITLIAIACVTVVCGVTFWFFRKHRSLFRLS